MASRAILAVVVVGLAAAAALVSIFLPWWGWTQRGNAGGAPVDEAGQVHPFDDAGSPGFRGNVAFVSALLVVAVIALVVGVALGGVGASGAWPRGVAAGGIVALAAGALLALTAAMAAFTWADETGGFWDETTLASGLVHTHAAGAGWFVSVAASLLGVAGGVLGVAGRAGRTRSGQVAGGAGT